MTKIIQIMPPSHPLQLRFEKFATPYLVNVEFIALVDYDGQTEIEYAGIMDGHLLLFNVDGSEVAIERVSPPIMQFATNFITEKKKRAREGYGL